MNQIDIRRKNSLNAIREAGKLASFDEFPVLRPDVDPQLHLSRNTVDQPFFLTCEKDCVIALMSGRATLHFTLGPVRYYDMEPGDFVYVPGGTPHRVEPHEECIQLRYKARDAGLEAVSWHCRKCAGEVRRHVWDTAETLPQDGYARAAEEFNADIAWRTCPQCGEVHDPVDLGPFRWRAVAERLRDEAR